MDFSNSQNFDRSVALGPSSLSYPAMEFYSVAVSVYPDTFDYHVRHDHVPIPYYYCDFVYHP